MKKRTWLLKSKLLNNIVYKLLKIFKRKGMPTELENELNLDPGSWLMWIKSDKLGDRVEISEVDDQWIKFTDGSRISLALAPEYLANSSPGVAVKPSKNAKVAETIKNTFSANAEPVKEVADPIVNMLKTLSKKNVTEFPITLTVKIPSPTMYGVMTSELDEADLKEAISKMIIEQIDINSITEQIKTNTHTFINNYYGK